jgi:hypothetical protein
VDAALATQVGAPESGFPSLKTNGAIAGWRRSSANHPCNTGNTQVTAEAEILHDADLALTTAGDLY